MLKLAYQLGCLEALIKLGATEVMKALTPSQQAYMQRMTEFGAPTAPLTPTLRKAQREWKHVANTKVPELIGASEDYVRAGQKGMNAEGIQKSKAQGRILDDWVKSKGPQVQRAPGLQGAAPAVAAGGTAATGAAAPSAIRAAKQQGLGTAETAYNIVSKKPRPGIQFAKTIARRFAHI